MLESSSFGVADATIFVVMILVAMGIGIFYGIKDRNKTSLKNYFYAEQQMSTIPVGISLGVTFVSSITILSIPVLTYNHGAVIFWYGITSCLFAPIPAFLYFIPLFQRLKMPSIFNYLELRFSPSVRKACSFISCFLMISWMGTACYLTSLALSVVFPLSATESTFLTAAIVTFYTVIGGIKAVVWVDTVQSVVMITGVIAISAVTATEVGGIGEAWKALAETGRDNFFTFDTDVTVVYSVWTLFFGLGTSYAQYYCCNQMFAQRFQSCRNTKQARIACVISGTISCLIIILSTFSGCLVYAYFKDCDPFMSKKIEDEDQMVPYLVLNVFKNVPGVAGLFVSAAYSAMLSTVSSGINSASTLILEDFVRSCVTITNDRRAIQISKGIGVIVGITVMLASFAVGHIGDIAFVLINTIESAVGGPLLALFSIGAFLPWTNKIGGFVGFVSGVCVNLWIAIGNKVYGETPGSLSNPKLLTSINGCSNETLFFINNMTTSSALSDDIDLLNNRPLLADTLYQISYFYYSLVGFFTTVIISLVVSFATGRRNPQSSDPAFFIPLFNSSILPDKIQKFFYFGVPKYQEENSVFYLQSIEKEEMNKSQDPQETLKTPFI